MSISSHKAVGLLSGGLDSALAAAVLKAQGIEVHAVFIEMPWGCGKGERIKVITGHLGIPLKIIPLGNDYLQILKKPKFGFGSAFNPCVDCHIYMVKKAAEYMTEIGAEFVFTGEVLGQRPMSQRHQCLLWVEKEAGIPGRLLRPLSAAFLEPTIPEEKGIVDRAKLPAIEGRSRKAQYALAAKLGVEHFAQPSGGCLLTEKYFGARLKDVLKRGCDDISATAVLGLGRYFRVNDGAFVIVGRDEKENEKIIRYSIPGDILFRAEAFPGPVALLRTAATPGVEAVLPLAAGLVQFHSKWRDKLPQEVVWWIKSPEVNYRNIRGIVPDSASVKAMML